MSSTSTSDTHTMWQKALEHIPQFLKFNPRIVRGYRVGYTLPSLMRSLFQWHNETINAWTHLIGTLIIFAVIFSSNLFTQHYHSQHQLLLFGENLQAHRMQIELGFENMTSSAMGSPDQMSRINSNITDQIGRIEKELQILVMLIEQDNNENREVIANHLKLLQNARKQLEDIFWDLALEMEEVFLQESKEKIAGVRTRLNLYFLDLIKLIKTLPNSVNPIPKWPLLIFLCSASLCLTFSFIFHLFHPHSETLYRNLRKLDFSGVVLLIVGSSFPLFIYGGSCVETLSVAYLSVMSIVGIAVFGLLMSSYFDPKERQRKKSMMFGLFGVSFLIPMCHLLILQKIGQSQDTLVFSPFALRTVVFGAIYLIGLLIYTVQCPERFVPGRFDYCGASHQIWHLLVLLALYITYQLNWDLYYQRRIHPCLS